MGVTCTKKTQRIPPGGYGFESGRVFSRSEVTTAVSRYARRHGYCARTVRVVTSLFRAAMKEVE